MGRPVAAGASVSDAAVWTTGIVGCERLRRWTEDLKERSLQGVVRVLMVTDGLWNGGKERQLVLLADSLPESWSATVLSMEDGPFRHALEERGIELRIVPRHYRLDVAAAARMWRVAADIEPDVVHAWGWMSAYAMIPYCRMHRVPLLNGMIRLAYEPRKAPLARSALALADAVVANSRAGLAFYGIAESESVRVIYNGFDPNRLDLIDGVRRDLCSHEGVVAVMAARMAQEKDWSVFLQAARELADEEPRWSFVAVGVGPERDALRAEAADLISQGVVRFPEGSLEVIPLIARADVGVLATDPRYHAEGCSNSIMEYMACGLPVVCTDSGGNGELVVDGITGMLIPPQDKHALIDALRALGADRDLARGMGREGERRLKEHFSAERMTDEYVSLYETMVGKARAAR